jgi:hypothetical protein
MIKRIKADGDRLPDCNEQRSEMDDEPGYGFLDPLARRQSVAVEQLVQEIHFALIRPRRASPDPPFNQPSNDKIALRRIG